MYVKKENIVAPILYLSIAGIALIFAIICFSMKTDYPYWVYSINEYYNGDAYTGIQNVGFDISQNVRELGNVVRDFSKISTSCSGFILLIVSFVLATLGIKGLLPTKYIKIEEKKEELNTVAETETQN